MEKKKPSPIVDIKKYSKEPVTELLQTNGVSNRLSSFMAPNHNTSFNEDESRLELNPCPGTFQEEVVKDTEAQKASEYVSDKINLKSTNDEKTIDKSLESAPPIKEAEGEESPSKAPSLIICINPESPEISRQASPNMSNFAPGAHLKSVPDSHMSPSKKSNLSIMLVDAHEDGDSICKHEIEETPQSKQEKEPSKDVTNSKVIFRRQSILHHQTLINPETSGKIFPDTNIPEQSALKKNMLVDKKESFCDDKYQKHQASSEKRIPLAEKAQTEFNAENKE